MSQKISSWGGVDHHSHHLQHLQWLTNAELNTLDYSRLVLPFGLGRSYGDSCLNSQNALLMTKALNRFISFDETSGLLKCEAGVSLADILAWAVPKGWFLNVTPGTKFVTVGGAIANDVHGKNHHLKGTFGSHVTQFEILRSTGERLLCSLEQNTDLFRATIGGLGLTGLILWAEIRLRPISSAYLQGVSIKFDSLDEYFEISKANDSKYEFTVSWVDSLSSKGRGIYMAANFEEKTHKTLVSPAPSGLQLSVPFYFPGWALNKVSVKMFNNLYFKKQGQKEVSVRTHFEPFFYPLDSVLNWNRIYGRRGFYQYQFCLPHTADNGVLKKIFQIISQSGFASFLSVMKNFGGTTSPGMLSFPAEGITLAMDFANVGKPLLDLFTFLDQLVLEANGRLYPAKDGRMPESVFKKCYPNWDKFKQWQDPKFSSSFWRRVTGEIKGESTGASK